MSMKCETWGVPNKVSVVIEKDDFGYYAYCPELDGCQSQGDSLEEAIANIKDAIELYLSTLSEEGKKDVLSREILTTAGRGKGCLDFPAWTAQEAESALYRSDAPAKSRKILVDRRDSRN